MPETHSLRYLSSAIGMAQLTSKVTWHHQMWMIPCWLLSAHLVGCHASMHLSHLIKMSNFFRPRDRERWREEEMIGAIESARDKGDSSRSNMRGRAKREIER